MTTPLGGIYLGNSLPLDTTIHLEVVHPHTGEVTEESIASPEYVYPHTVLGRTADLRDYLADREMRIRRNLDVSKYPPRFTKLNGLWGSWTGEEILNDQSPIKPLLDEEEEGLIKELGIKLYVFLGFTIDLWDEYNDVKLNLRKKMRLLQGGLQLATRHMPQGSLLTIPLTRNIGYQNISHVIIHFDNADPDLGRKSFQPEHTELAQKLSASAVRAFIHYYPLLRARTGAPALQQEMKLDQWITRQKEHELRFPLVITGKGLFQPTEELAIRSTPLVEQDVVALFNQMLTSGIIRGIQLLSSSQYKQYDGLYRIKMLPPYERYIRGPENPLGVESETFIGADDFMESKVSVLEYKLNLDSLIEEFHTEDKLAGDIGLVIAWEIGSKWQEAFDVTSYLDDNNVHHRQFHGFTHSFAHSSSHSPAFEAIILKDLVQYLMNPAEESERQRNIFSDDLDI